MDQCCSVSYSMIDCSPSVVAMSTLPLFNAASIVAASKSDIAYRIIGSLDVFSTEVFETVNSLLGLSKLTNISTTEPLSDL